MRAKLHITLVLLAAAVGLVILAGPGCTGGAQQQGPACTKDGDCDPGDDCIGGTCQGDSAHRDAGNDAGLDAGANADAGADAGNTDAGADAGTDAGGADAGADAGTDAGTVDAGPIDGGVVTYTGGTVDLLDFVTTGDTRPPNCDQTSAYPKEIIQKEVAQMAKLPSQFAADTGDHLNACIQSKSSIATQLGYYGDAVKQYPHPWFMGMGNHECGNALDCNSSFGSWDANFAGYKALLADVSKQTQVYYFIDVQTRLGLVRLVWIADSYGGSGPQQWLQATLAEADTKAVSTIILKHFPLTGSRQGDTWAKNILETHKISLVLTGHDHLYSHDPGYLDGRTVICGLGGADTSSTGFCRVQQQPDGSWKFTRYDIDSNALDTWSVSQRGTY